jgi:hypothetical protein
MSNMFFLFRMILQGIMGKGTYTGKIKHATKLPHPYYAFPIANFWRGGGKMISGVVPSNLAR